MIETLVRGGALVTILLVAGRLVGERFIPNEPLLIEYDRPAGPLEFAVVGVFILGGAAILVSVALFVIYLLGVLTK